MATKCVVCGFMEKRRWRRHYGADDVCLSCAIFFGRSAGKKLYCKNEGKCRKLAVLIQSPVNGRHPLPVMRKCRACRLKKCYQIGMKPEEIGSRPKIVRAIKSANKEDTSALIVQNFVLATDLSDISLLNSLLYTEQKFMLLFNSVIQFPKSFTEPIFEFADFKALILASKKWNLLEEMAKDLQNFGDKLCQVHGGDRWERLKETSKKKCWKTSDMTRDVAVFLELAKTMPAINQMELEDQIRLLSHLCVPMIIFCRSFYSAKNNADVLIWPGDVPMTIFMIGLKCASDCKMEYMATKAFFTPIKDFKNVELSREEMVTLRALLFLQTVTMGLSKDSQERLSQEANKYAQLLLKLFQIRIGPLGGARKYFEALQLIPRVFRSAQVKYEMTLYRDIFHEKGQIAALAPKAVEVVRTSGAQF